MRILLTFCLFFFASSLQVQAQTLESFYQFEGTLIEVVAENGHPIEGAKVLIGFAKDDPFEGNIFITNPEGIIQIPSLWKTPLPVTVQANGYLTTTFSEALPLGRTLILQEADQKTAYELNGNVTGFGNLRKDGKVDVGFVMPSFSRRELLAFDISSVISPETDTIQILNREVKIPSNISLPRQTETYIFPITLNKPSYRIFSRKQGVQDFIAGHAQFPLKRVVDKIRGGQSILDVINDISFLGGGQIRVDMSSQSSTRDIPVDTFKYTDSLTLPAPQIPQGKVVFSMAVTENQGRLFPTDLKYVETNKNIQLVTMASNDQKYIASLLGNKPEETAKNQWSRIDFINTPQFESPLSLFGFSKDQDSLIPWFKNTNLTQMSITLQKYTSGIGAPDFLPLVDAPVLNDGFISLTPPPANSSIIPLGTMVVFSEIETIPQGQYSSEKRTRLWEIFSPDWTNRVNVPELNFRLSNEITHRWEVIYLGKKVGSSDSEGLDAVTHITRNSISIQ
ncbi:MAG: carboxypeptidase regulatory-like domain-containing protein [Bdellovibrionales bacterium]|nr:carboxypeptidase regulatory-like domain-containing protein [Bdellovibrionales bacterium]